MSEQSPYWRVFIFTLVCSVLLPACGGGLGSSDSDADNNPTFASVGKKLFFDTSLSSRGNQSCASCHDPDSGFADPDVTRDNPVSEGSEANAFGTRNAPTAAYASFIPDFSSTSSTTEDGTTSQYQGGQFLDGRAIDLKAQAGAPFLNPMEMNNADKSEVVNKVSLAPYADEFRQLFGSTIFDDIELAYDKIAFAIAVFEASSEMNPFSSKFDAVMAGNAEFSPSEQRGFDLFQSDQSKCANCHTLNSPPQRSLFTDFNYFNVGTPANPNNPPSTKLAPAGLFGLAGVPTLK